MSQLTPEERAHLAKGQALLEGVPRFLQPAGALVDVFSATQAAIPDCIFARNLSKGQLSLLAFGPMPSFGIHKTRLVEAEKDMILYAWCTQ